MCRLNRVISVLVIVLSILAFPMRSLNAASEVKPSDKWWGTEVETTYRNGDVKNVVFIPPEKAKKPYSIGVLVPHFKDTYWIAVNYGLVQEAKRLGVKMVFMEAGGYANLSKQLDQVDDMLQKGIDGLILGAVKPDPLGHKVDTIWKKQRLPVVAVVMDTNATDILSKVFYYYTSVGRMMAEYVYKRGGGKVVMLPGPPGLTWAEGYYKGFKGFIEENPGKIEILAVKYGETGKDVQLGLLEDALQTFPKIDYLVAMGLAAEASPPVLERAGRSKEIKVISAAIRAGIPDFIKEGKILASAFDHPAMYPRMGLALLVKYLNGEPLENIPRQIMSPVQIVDQAGLKHKYVRDHEFAPEGYTPIFTVNY